MIFFRVLALALFIFVPGWLAVSLPGRRVDGLKEGERFYLAWVAGTGLVAFCAEVLALASSYSLAGLLLVVGSAALLLALAARRKACWLRDLGAVRLLLVLVLVAAALSLFVPPGHTIHSFSDVGVYPNIAAKMVRQGELHSEYLTVREVSPERRHMLYWPNLEPGIPFEAVAGSGFFITDFERGEVVPQFYYLWPSLMAVFASFLGLENMFWAITAVAVLALGGIFLLARRMLGGRWGCAALLLAALSPLMVYFSRYTTSEMLNMNLFIAGSLCLMTFLSREEGEDEEGAGAGKVGLAIAAALYFTLGFFCRIDFSLAAIPLAAFFFCKRILKGTSAADLWFLGLTLAGAAFSLLMGVVFSAPYFYDTWRKTALGWFWLFRFPGVLLLLFTLAALVLCFVFGPRLRNGLRKLVRFRRLGYVLIWVALAAVFVYVYYIRSVKVCPPGTLYGVDPETGFSHANQGFVRWTWYFSFTGVVFMYIGYALWLTRARGYSRLPVVLTGLAYTLIYSWSLNDVPLHFICMRRLLPVIMPLAVIMIAYVLKSLPEGVAWAMRKRPWGRWTAEVLAAGLFLYLALFSLNASIPVLGLREGGNQVELCADIAAQVEEGGVVLMDYNLGARFGPPLRCFHGLQEGWVFGNSQLESEDFKALLGDLGFPHTPIYLLWWPGQSGKQVPLPGGLTVEDAGRFRWQEELMETSIFHRPEKRESISRSLRLYRIEPE